MNSESVHLVNPDVPALQNAYRTLLRAGDIDVRTGSGKMSDTLRSMESTGFVGMKIEYINPSSGSVDIRAYKGKNGPCYNTGKVALYHGAALAILDDDNHLLFSDKKIRICEKTAKIYNLPPYEKLIKCSDGDPLLMAKLDDIPEIFDCNSFEDDSEELFQMISKREKEEEAEDLFYPGPFRLLILKDGRIIKRGQVSRIPKSDVKQLMAKDGLFRIGDKEASPTLFFNELYSANGSMCLLDNLLTSELTEPEREADFTQLRRISPELKEHLLRLIEKNKKYFLLTGSDLSDISGCCPSEIVTEANRLAKAGILDSNTTPETEETCPVTIYAFINEIKNVDNELQFNIDYEFRERVHKIIHDKKDYTLRVIAKWILLAFIALSITIALIKFFETSSPSSGLNLYEQLAPGNVNQQYVLLFHNSERCSQCLRMEKFTNDVLNEDFNGLIAEKKLQFRLITMDTPDNLNLVKRFNIFTTTLVFVQFENKRESKIKVLNDSWGYSGDEVSFKEMLRTELNQFLNRNE